MSRTLYHGFTVRNTMIGRKGYDKRSKMYNINRNTLVTLSFLEISQIFLNFLSEFQAPEIKIRTYIRIEVKGRK
jgi:hypothetical protein